MSNTRPLAEDVEIVSTHDEDGIIVTVKEYETVDRRGERVIVQAFWNNGFNWVSVMGWKFKKDGTIQQRVYKSLEVAIPANVQAMLDADEASRNRNRY